MEMTSQNVLKEIIFSLSKQSVAHIMQAEAFSAMGLSKLKTKFAEHAEEERDFMQRMTKRYLEIADTRDLSSNLGSSMPVMQDILAVFEHEREISQSGLDALADVLNSNSLDIATYELVKSYYLDELEDLNYTEEQLSLIDLVGKKNYLAQQI